MDVLRFQVVPLLLALGIHALAGLALYGGWNPEREVSQVIKPKIVTSTLVVMEPKAKRAPAPQPPPKPQVSQPQPKPQPKVQPQPKPAEPVPTAEEIRRKADEAARKQAERLREERLRRLADQAFSQALAEEANALADSDDAAAAQSYRQGIFELIVANWSRPPSARNGMKAKLLVELVPTGEVVAVSVVESSGNGAFDRSAEQAVRKARKFEVPKDMALFERSFRQMYLLFQPEDLLR